MADAPPGRRPGHLRAMTRPYLVIALTALAAVAGLAVRPSTPVGEQAADYVVIAGATGLRWEDVDPERTPNLWRLATAGAVGSLAARPARRPACPVDGWLTLGAGNWATAATGATDGCVTWEEVIETPDATSAFLPHQAAWVRYNGRELPWGAVPGTLAGSVRCTVAVGQGAAVAAARSYGGVDWYVPRLPVRQEDASALLARCVLGIVDLGTVSGSGSRRAAAVRRVDAALGQVMAARPGNSVLLVAGVADPGADPGLHVAVAEGPGLDAGWLTSASTGRSGLLQLVDLAPTAVTVLGRPPPEPGRLAGHVAHAVPARPDDLAEAVRSMVATDQEADRTSAVTGWFLVALTVGQLLLFTAVVPLLRRPWRPAGGRWRPAAPVLLVAAVLLVPAALAAGVIPWWQTAAGAALFVTLVALMVAASTAAVVTTPLFRHTLAVVGACAALVAAVVAADLLARSQLQLNGVVGYSAHDGVRFAGISAAGLGALTAGVLLAAGVLAQQVPRRWRPVVVVALGGLGVVFAGSPYLGADPAAAMALIAGVCVAAAMCTGGWLTVSRLGWAVLAGAAVTGAVALADVWRPAEQRVGLGAFVTDLTQGRAGFAARRLSLANAEALLDGPLTLLAIGAAAFAWFALLRPWGGLHRLFGIYPALRAGMMGTLVAAVLAGVLTGSALTVAGAAAAVAMPLVTLAALRVREQVAARGEVDDPQPVSPRLLG